MDDSRFIFLSYGYICHSYWVISIVVLEAGVGVNNQM